MQGIHDGRPDTGPDGPDGPDGLDGGPDTGPDGGPDGPGGPDVGILLDVQIRQRVPRLVE